MKIIDGIMSIGKTTYAIDMINNDTENNYIYITPYLDEVDRIKKECRVKNFVMPDEKRMGTKTRHFKHLINQGKNIVATHSLFRGADDELKELLKAQNYILVLDEVLDVVEPLKVSKKDMVEILDRYAHIDELSKQLIWDDLDYNGNHYEIKSMALNNSLTVVNGVILLWNFPISIFKSFKSVYILTYMFEHQIQRYYFDYYDVEYNKYSLELDDNGNRILTEFGKSKYESTKIDFIRNNLNIYEGNLNSIGDDLNSLSKSWFDRNDGKIISDRLQKNIQTYFKNNTKTKSKLNGWTTFKKFKKSLSGDGYTRGFIPINMRASNDYKHKQSMAYIGNRFLNPFVKAMFSYKNVSINEEMWGLSEMLQWIWRGCIREDKPMNLYIPSKRMRDSLLKWLDNTD